MTLLMSLPAYLKVGLAFGAILVVYRAGMSLGWSILTMSLVLTLWTGLGSQGLVYQAHEAVQVDTVLLLMIIALLLFFTASLNKTGKMGRTVEALKARFSRAHLLVGGLPALVGLLPMPGGALFSAPLVQSMDPESRYSPALKATANYWFRHIWEYWWPLYPGVILAITYSRLPALLYFAVMIPFSIVAVIAGYVFILRRMKSEKLAVGTPPAGGKRDIADTVVPIAVLVVFTLLGAIILPHFGITGAKTNLVGMLAGLAAGLVLVFRGSWRTFGEAVQSTVSPTTRGLLVVILGVRMFSAALQMPLNDVGMTLVSSMRDEFMALGIPILLVIMLLPFISGMVTGVAVGFTGASFPLVFALIGEAAPLNVVVATTVLAFGFGYMGMLISPVHICFVVSTEYFKSRLFASYPYLLGPVLTVTAATLLLAGLYYVVL